MDMKSVTTHKPTIGQQNTSNPFIWDWKKVRSIEWLGQTAASIFWIVSVFTYGLTAVGDWLQLTAAVSWFIANLSAVIRVTQDNSVPKSDAHTSLENQHPATPPDSVSL